MNGREERRNWGERSDHMSYIGKGALNMGRTTEDAPAKTSAKFTQFRGVEVIAAYLPGPPTLAMHDASFLSSKLARPLGANPGLGRWSVG